MKFKKLTALLLALALTAALAACASKEDADETEADETGTAVEVMEVSADTIATDNTVSGSIAADEERSIYVSVTAKCTAVYVQAGDTVQAGDKICKLDLDSTIASQKAAEITYGSTATSYDEQKAIFAKQIALYQNTLDTTKALYEIGAASQLEIDQAQLALDGAIAQRDSTLSQLEAGMQSYKSSLDQLNLVLQDVDAEGNVIAPISGTLVSLNAIENSYISQTYPVAVVDGVEQMKVTVNVSEALVPKLNIGDSAEVTVSAANQTFTAKIRSVEKSANQMKLYAVTLSVPADVTGLLSGMFADVTFHTDVSADTLVIPSEAVLTSDDEQVVFTVNGDTVTRQVITTGLTGNGVTEVTSGLDAGQTIVTVGQSYLEDGDTVRVVSSEG